MLTEKTITDSLTKAIKEKCANLKDITDKEFVEIQTRFMVLCRRELEGQATVAKD